MGFVLCLVHVVIGLLIMSIEEWEKGVKNIIDGISPKLTPVLGNQNCTIIAYNN
jgi:hypothetical protein